MQIDEVIRRVRTLAVGSWVALAISLAATPVLSRLYSTAEFGLFGMVTAVIAIAMAVATLRLDSAVVIAGTNEAASAAFGAGIVSTGMSALLIVPVVSALLTVWGTEVDLSSGEVVLVVAMSATILGAQGVALMCMGWLIRSAQVRPISLARTTEAATEKAVSVGLGLLGLSGSGLVVGRMVGALALVTSTRGAQKVPRPGWVLKRTEWHHLRVFRDHIRYAPATVLIGELAQWLPLLAVGMLYGAKAAGLMVLARQVVAMPINGVGIAIQRVLLREARDASRGSTESEQLARLCELLLTVCVVVAITIVSALFTVGSDLLDLFLGSNWIGFGDVAAVLSIGYAAGFVHLCFSGLFDAFQVHRTRLVLDVTLLALRLGVLLAAWGADLSMTTTFWLIAMLSGFIYSLGVVNVLGITSIWGASRIVSSALRGGGVAIAAAVAVSVLGAVAAEKWMQVVAFVLVAVICFVTARSAFVRVSVTRKA